MNYDEIARRAVRDHLLEVFADLDPNSILNDDPAAADLNDEDWQRVADAILNVKVNINVQ